MLKNIPWIVIKAEFNRVKGELKMSDDTPISLNITPKHGEQITKRIKFGQFLEHMWRLYDSKTEIRKVNAIQSKDGSSFFEYDTPSDVMENKPIHGNGSIILEFKNLTNTAREVHIHLLLTQILEDQTCIQNNSIPPSGNPS